MLDNFAHSYHQIYSYVNQLTLCVKEHIRKQGVHATGRYSNDAHIRLENANCLYALDISQYIT